MVMKMEIMKSRKKIFEGKIIEVVLDAVELEDGLNASREVVVHPGGACMALLGADGKYLLVRQYRYAVKQSLLEFPAGRLEKGECPLDAIQREIAEETGYEASSITSMGILVPTGGYLTEVIHMYHGHASAYVGQALDIDERIQIESYTLIEIIEMIMNGSIIDAKTIALAFKIQAFKQTL